MKQIINIYFPAPDQTEQRPGIRMSDPAFISGYESGLHAGLHGVNAGIPMSDTELVELLTSIFAEPGQPDAAAVHSAIGSILGQLTARW